MALSLPGDGSGSTARGFRRQDASQRRRWKSQEKPRDRLPSWGNTRGVSEPEAKRDDEGQHTRANCVRYEGRMSNPRSHVSAKRRRNQGSNQAGNFQRYVRTKVREMCWRYVARGNSEESESDRQNEADDQRSSEIDEETDEHCFRTDRVECHSCRVPSKVFREISDSHNVNSGSITTRHP